MEIAPNRIELSQLSGGFSPDAPEAAVTLDASPEVMNLLPDPASKMLEVRKGGARLDGDGGAGRLEGQNGYWIRHVNYYETLTDGERFRGLVCILTNGQDDIANNVKVYVYDLLEDTFTRVDTAGRVWTNARNEHWNAVIEGTYYGGTSGEVMYSWHPDDGWDADPSTPDVKTWVDDTGDSVNTATEYPRDFAFKANTLVKYGSKWYTSARDIRYKDWRSGDHYSKGELVSRYAVWESTDNYWKSFRCIKSHIADAAKAPGTGADTATYWKLVRLTDVLNSDGDLTDDWFFNPLPAKTNVGAYHGTRLFLRRNDEDNRSRLQYSAPAVPEKNEEIADLTWHPKDWAARDDLSGDGGGWLDVPFSGKGDAIRALYSFGNYLIIAGRWQTYVLAGTNEATWTLRKLGNFGALGPQAICEHDGLVYLLSAHGSLAVTDGTSMEELPGMGKAREWVKQRTDDLLLGQDEFNWYPTIWSYGHWVWVSLPDNDGVNYTLVYDPETQSFWPLDLPVLDAAVGEAGRAQRMYFSTPLIGEPVGRPTLYEYKDQVGRVHHTDDDYLAEDDHNPHVPIEWYHRTAWFQFGATRNERRIRRVWAVVGNAGDETTITVEQYRNFNNHDEVVSVDRDLENDRKAQFVEGKTQPDSYAMAVKLSSAATTGVTLQGYGIDTEPRRVRFHRG